MTNLSTPPPLARRTDPTARNIGQSGYAKYQREKCLAAVRDNPGCTAAEMSPQQKSSISHRGQAVRSFAVLLNDFLAQRG